MRRLLPVALAALALTLVPAASGTIVLQKGMAGIRIGMTKQAVRGVLDEPLRIARGTNEFGPWTEFRYPHRVRVFFQGNRRVTSISTTGTFERTRRGVGVGSTEAEVEAKVPGVRCETIVGVRSCHVGAFLPGRRVTDFLLRAAHVTRVTVGVVID